MATGGSLMPSSAGLGARPGQLPSLPSSSAESTQAAQSKSPFQARASARGSPHRFGLTKARGCAGFPTSASCAATQRRLSPAEAEASIADYAGGGRVGEMARIYGIRRTTVTAHMSRAGKTRGQPTAAQPGEGGAALRAEGSLSTISTHALGATGPVAYRRHIENRIRAGNAMLP